MTKILIFRKPGTEGYPKAIFRLHSVRRVGYGRIRLAATGCFLGRAEIAWLVGGAVVGPLCYFVARPRKIASATEPKITAAVAS